MEQKGGVQVGAGLEGRLAGQAAPAKQRICYDGKVSTFLAGAHAHSCLTKVRLEPHPGAKSSRNLCFVSPSHPQPAIRVVCADRTDNQSGAQSMHII